MATGLTIYDAVDVAAIPASATTLLAYIDGDYVTLPAVRARFPKATILTVTTNGRSKADICDVESGDATPAIAAQGVRDGLYDNVYSALENEDALFDLLAGKDWNWFAADPTGEEHLVPRSVATQWAWPGHGSPGNFDISVTNGVWPAPTPGPSPIVLCPAIIRFPYQEVPLTEAEFFVWVRGWWYLLRTDGFPAGESNLLWALLNTATTTKVEGTDGFGGSLDLVLANIHDTAGSNLR